MNQNNARITHEISELSSDLHWALSEIPLEGQYLNKLDLYAEKLITNYNWTRIHKYPTHDLLDMLPPAARVLTADNSIAVKHETGWVVLDAQGYVFSRIETSTLQLPAFSVPEVDNS